MSRRTLTRAILTGIILAYIVIMVPLTNRAERNDTFSHITIDVQDPNNHGFLTAAQVNEYLGHITDSINTLRRCNLNTLELQNKLRAMDRIENASCLVLNNGTLLIEVKPFRPVARIFDPAGTAYVNAAGKRVAALPQHHVDVPVITSATVADSAMVTSFLPLLRTLATDTKANALVSALAMDANGDIIIIPNVLGHVINFGDTTAISDKFARLHAFYRDVMPVRGWNAYDTLSVKWAGRVVATKRNKLAPALHRLDNLADVTDEVPDDGVMSTDVNPEAAPVIHDTEN